MTDTDDQRDPKDPDVRKERAVKAWAEYKRTNPKPPRVPR